MPGKKNQPKRRGRPPWLRRGDAFQGFDYARVKTAAGFFT